MKAVLIFSLCLCALVVQGQTNFFPFLNCASNVVYTNATIMSVTPAFADVDFDGGIARVPLANLPDFLQQRYYYDPTNAAQFAVQEKAREAARKLAKAKAAAEQARLDALNVGPLCTIQIDAIIDEQFGSPKCSVSSGNGGGVVVNIPSQIIIQNLPSSVTDFLKRFNGVQDQIAFDKQHIKDLKDKETRAENNAQVAIAVGTDADYANANIAENNISAAIQKTQDDLDEQESNLEEMKQNFSEDTRIVAHFTGHIYSGFQIWVCGE
jgi:hypothetical protein